MPKSVKIIISIIIVIIGVWLMNESTPIHEYGHFVTARALGLDPILLPDKVTFANGTTEAMVRVWKAGLRWSFDIALILAGIEILFHAILRRVYQIWLCPTFTIIPIFKILDIIAYHAPVGDDITQISRALMITRASATNMLINDVIIFSFALWIVYFFLVCFRRKRKVYYHAAYDEKESGPIGR